MPQESFPIGRRGLLGLAIAASVSAVSLHEASAQAANDASAATHVQQLDAALLASMKAGRSVPFAQRYAMLEPVIDQTFDLDASTGRIDRRSGRHCRAISKPSCALHSGVTQWPATPRISTTSLARLSGFRRPRVSWETATSSWKQKSSRATVRPRSSITSCATVRPGGKPWMCWPTAPSAVWPCSAPTFATCCAVEGPPH